MLKSVRKSFNNIYSGSCMQYFFFHYDILLAFWETSGKKVFSTALSNKWLDKCTHKESLFHSFNANTRLHGCFVVMLGCSVDDFVVCIPIPQSYCSAVKSQWAIPMITGRTTECKPKVRFGRLLLGLFSSLQAKEWTVSADVSDVKETLSHATSIPIFCLMS